MNREEKIEAIYEEIADKTLSFGCLYKIDGSIETYYPGDIIRKNENKLNNFYGRYCIKKEGGDKFYIKVIGHPVMIGDVMYWIRKKYRNNHSRFHTDRSKLIDLRSKEREPIEGQYDECIDFVYSLIKK